MPELPEPKERTHPSKATSPTLTAERVIHRRALHGGGGSPYAELQVTTNFTFLTGGSHPEELVAQAAALGHHAVAVTDTHTLAGIVRAYVAAKQAGIGLIVGSRLRLRNPIVSCRDDGDDGSRPPIDVLVYPADRAAYGRLCRLLTFGKRRAPKGECHLTLHDLVEHHEGLLAVVVPGVPGDAIDSDFASIVCALRGVFDNDRLSIALCRRFGADDESRFRQVMNLSSHTGVPLVAINDVHYHAPSRRPLQDVLTCIHLGCTLDEAGLRLWPNAERHLKPPAEMARLFAACPRAIERTIQIADRAGQFRLDELKYQYPHEVCPPGLSPMQYLRRLTDEGAAHRYPRGVPDRVRQQVEHEFQLIDELQYAPYFLTVHDLVRFARSRGILCQGRGAAANSAVCYCLGVTAVDPNRIDVLFERFVSRERNEPPDIDIDFEHERREEVIQYIYAKYGRDRAALTAEVITYRGRSAVREVGKALGLSLDCVDRLARDIDWWQAGPVEPRQLRELGLNAHDPTIARLLQLTEEIRGFPRHLSQHVGGFVITQGPLCELVPIENAAMEDRTVIEWDKDDIDAMGMLKVDVLGLGMLTCIRKTFELIHHQAVPAASVDPVEPGAPEAQLELHNVPAEDPAVYDMICDADTVGVFQIESRAQMSMLPRLRPRRFYDLVIEVAIVRPGPIQGNMVHPYLRRRNGEEPITYPNAQVEQVLGKTLGVPLFQEQAMALAIVAAGFTPDEADQLRRAMAAWKRKGDKIAEFGQKLIAGMLARGYTRDFAERCFEQIKGFSEYGFPESHAASFALLVYISAWLKRHHPAAFAAALINSQPMGFYAPAQIVRDVKQHGIEVRPIDVNHSRWDCTLERDNPAPPLALRLGMRLVKGLKQTDADAIARAVNEHGRCVTLESLWRRSGVPVTALRRLAAADAFRSMGMDRQSALWHVRALRDEPAPLFDLADQHHEHAVSPPDPVALPAIPDPRKVIHDYIATGLSLKAHPIAFLRPELDRRGVTPAEHLADTQQCPHGRPIRIAGLVLIRQRPATASGIIFMTLEDETGIANLIVRPHIYARCRKAARHGVVVEVHGKVERQGQVVHIMAHRIHCLDRQVAGLMVSSRDFH